MRQSRYNVADITHILADITTVVQASVKYFVTEPCFVTFFIQFDHAYSKSDESQILSVEHF